ncbi:hypothetical protein K1Y38_25765 [Serratia marcescens]|uniref:hypothetical protein n=1 Tax=Enterococcus TaxID=1350 RepID=UPI001FBA5CDE|nr:hypothetical protein [Enterococcus mundtii]MCW6016162.1 hypothetical protein [Serratia marcescens]GKS56115.1 lipoprotein, putative [Enterococcus mundtii]
MRKWLLVLVSGMAIVLLSACGGSSKKDEGTQEVIDKIIERNTEEKFSYTEDDFSFLIYYDEDTKLYLVDSWIPFKGEPNDLNRKYQVNLSKDKLQTYQIDSLFDDDKQSGNYEVVYKSGQFAD